MSEAVEFLPYGRCADSYGNLLYVGLCIVSGSTGVKLEQAMKTTVEQERRLREIRWLRISIDHRSTFVPLTHHWLEKFGYRSEPRDIDNVRHPRRLDERMVAQVDQAITSLSSK